MTPCRVLCDRIASECYEQSKATDYRGIVSKTKSGLTCLSWKIQTKGDGTSGYWTGSKGAADNGVGNHNYCRNPNDRPKAWCFTAGPTTISKPERWEVCDVGFKSMSSCTTKVNPSDSSESTESKGACLAAASHVQGRSISSVPASVRACMPVT